MHRRTTIAAALIISCLFAAPAAADVKAGVEAWRAGDYGAAVNQWRPLANRGDADAQFNMGQAYKLGRGVPSDIAIARTWYEKAAQQGHEQAQSNLGLLLFQAGDRKTAMYWIRKAADRDDARAQYVLGTALFNGDGVAKDWPRAYAMMSRAAAQGLEPAAASLERMDQHMLAADRQKGADLARQMEKGGSVLTGSATASLSPKAAPKMVLEPAATADAAVLAAPAATRPAPAPKPTRVAKDTPAPALARASLASPGGRWRVQLGAFESPAAARSRWARMTKKMPALAGLEPSYEPYSGLTRLRVGPLAGKAEADRLCAAAKAAGEGCFTVRP